MQRAETNTIVALEKKKTDKNNNNDENDGDAKSINPHVCLIHEFEERVMMGIRHVVEKEKQRLLSNLVVPTNHETFFTPTPAPAPAPAPAPFFFPNTPCDSYYNARETEISLPSSSNPPSIPFSPPSSSSSALHSPAFFASLLASDMDNQTLERLVLQFMQQRPTPFVGSEIAQHLCRLHCGRALKPNEKSRVNSLLNNMAQRQILERIPQEKNTDGRARYAIAQKESM